MIEEQGLIRTQVLQLMQKKDKIESEIRQLTEILNQNNVNMNEPLVDLEGFPINSIDIYQVRHARHRIIYLQNDHKNLMKEIENGLHGYYLASSSDHAMDTQPVQEEKEFQFEHKIPFAKITLVEERSPAEFAGLQVGDEIVEFGTVNFTNFKAITDIATVVQHSEGSSIALKVKRNDRCRNIQLKPKKWPGKGLLGCNIVSLL